VDHDQTAKVMVLEPLPDPGFQHLISDLENKIGQLQARLEDQETAQQLQARLEDQYKRQQDQLAEQYKKQLDQLGKYYLQQQNNMMVSLESQFNATVDFIFAQLGGGDFTPSSSPIGKDISPSPPSTSDTDTFLAPLPTPDTSNIYSNPLANNNSSPDNGTSATTAETPTTAESGRYL